MADCDLSLSHFRQSWARFCQKISMKYFISISLLLKAMSKRKMAAGVLFPLLLLESVFIAPVNALNAKKLYQLCSSFPLNSRCQGYEVPISLDDRSGKKGDCILNKNDLEKRGNCKVNVNEIGVTIYQEMGEKLEIINDKKSTQIIQISPK
ncbi:hypothetical protein [Nostoc sp. FACHB-190]|uniref:hypothetical protein n=1 Tax=Nostoc sp. FACHB-190 TaxID=2692838 RepID=UPI001684ED8E|nr:hypothetical protein [Nostoc sp. FACHB-190]